MRVDSVRKPEKRHKQLNESKWIEFHLYNVMIPEMITFQYEKKNNKLHDAQIENRNEMSNVHRSNMWQSFIGLMHIYT